MNWLKLVSLVFNRFFRVALMGNAKLEDIRGRLAQYGLTIKNRYRRFHEMRIMHQHFKITIHGKRIACDLFLVIRMRPVHKFLRFKPQKRDYLFPVSRAQLFTHDIHLIHMRVD